MRGLLVLSLLGFALTACHRAPSSSEASAGPPAPVTVAPAELVPLSPWQEVPGTIRPLDRAVIAAMVTGTIEPPLVVLGQAVRRGGLLAKLGASEMAARLAQARAQLH